MTNSYSGNDDQADASTRVLPAQGSGMGGYSGSGGQGSAGEVMQQVTDKAGEALDKVKEQAGTQIDTQKSKVSNTLGSVALAIRQTGTQLHDQDQANLAMVTDKAAEQIERFSTYLRDADMKQVATEVERFARRQPALFLGGALALGLFGARFLKSSSQQSRSDWDSYSGGYNRGYSGGYSQGYTGTGAGGYGYSGSGSANSPYIDRSYDASGGYTSEGSMSAGAGDMSGGSYGDSSGDSTGDGSSDSGVRERTWTGTSLEES